MQIAFETSRTTPAPAMRRGACPTLAAPMATGDGLLARLRPAEGEMGVAALRAVAAAAGRYGNGRIEVTSRGNLQLRGIRSDSVAALETAMLAALDIETGVPVEVSPLAGLDRDELLDPRPLAHRLREAIAAEDLSGQLSPKVTVIIESGGRLRRDHLVADLRLEAGTRGWSLRFGSEPVEEGLDDNAALAAVLARLRELAHRGQNARAGDARRPAPDDAPPIVGRHGLADGSMALGLVLGFGGIDATGLRGFADALDTLGINKVRLGFDHALLVPGLDAEQVAAVERVAIAHGLVADPRDPRLGIAACPGLGQCASSHIDTLGLAAAMQSDLLDGSLGLHLSGCAKGCAHATPATLVIVGSGEGCRVICNGRAGDAPLATVPAGAVLPGLERLGRLYREGRHAQETASQWLRRVEPRVIADAFA